MTAGAMHCCGCGRCGVPRGDRSMIGCPCHRQQNIPAPGAKNGGRSRTRTAVSGPLAGLLSVRNGCRVWTSQTRAEPSAQPANRASHLPLHSVTDWHVYQKHRYWACLRLQSQ